jgi:hypothetical protein
MPILPDVPAVSTAVGAAWAGRKILGPTLDKMGEQLRERYSVFSSGNLSRVIDLAETKLGQRRDQPGEFSPRVLLKIFDEAAWCDAPVMAEYFGGILAASRSEDGSDDRGASWASFVSRLASFDVYLHYLCFDAFRTLYVGETELNLGMETDRAIGKSGIYIPGAELIRALGADEIQEAWNTVLTPSISTLVRENLLGQWWGMGMPDLFEQRYQIDAPEPGIVFGVDLPGLELFNWAHGKRNAVPSAILDTLEIYEVTEDIGHLSGCMRIPDMQKERLARQSMPEA